MNNEVLKCPFCGSENWEWMGNEYIPNKYHCHECDRWFGKDDIEFENLRYKISAKISEVFGNEDKPLICKEPILIGEDEAQGLSTLEMPHVISMFHDCEGIIWFNIEGCEEPMIFDSFSLSDIKKHL